MSDETYTDANGVTQLASTEAYLEIPPKELVKDPWGSDTELPVKYRVFVQALSGGDCTTTISCAGATSTACSHPAEPGEDPKEPGPVDEAGPFDCNRLYTRVTGTKRDGTPITETYGEPIRLLVSRSYGNCAGPAAKGESRAWYVLYDPFTGLPIGEGGVDLEGSEGTEPDNEGGEEERTPYDVEVSATPPTYGPVRQALCNFAEGSHVAAGPQGGVASTHYAYQYKLVREVQTPEVKTYERRLDDGNGGYTVLETYTVPDATELAAFQPYDELVSFVNITNRIVRGYVPATQNRGGGEFKAVKAATLAACLCSTAHEVWLYQKAYTPGSKPSPPPSPNPPGPVIDDGGSGSPFKKKGTGSGGEDGGDDGNDGGDDGGNPNCEDPDNPFTVTPASKTVPARSASYASTLSNADKHGGIAGMGCGGVVADVSADGGWAVSALVQPGASGFASWTCADGCSGGTSVSVEGEVADPKDPNDTEPEPDPDDPDPTPPVPSRFIRIGGQQSEATFIVGAAASEWEVTVDATDAWRAVAGEAAPWLSFSPAAGISGSDIPFDFAFAANDSSARRSAVIEFRYADTGEVGARLNLIQLPTETIPEPVPADFRLTGATSLAFAADADFAPLSFYANCAWRAEVAEGADWISLDNGEAESGENLSSLSPQLSALSAQLSASAAGSGSGTLLADVAENATGEWRTGEIRFYVPVYADGSVCSVLAARVPVTQAPAGEEPPSTEPPPEPTEPSEPPPEPVVRSLKLSTEYEMLSCTGGEFEVTATWTGIPVLAPEDLELLPDAYLDGAGFFSAELTAFDAEAGTASWRVRLAPQPLGAEERWGYFTVLACGLGAVCAVVQGAYPRAPAAFLGEERLRGIFRGAERESLELRAESLFAR